MDEILWCGHSNEVSLAVLSIVLFVLQYLENNVKFGIFLEFLLCPLLRVKGLKCSFKKC